jgi:hypothetical protein
VNKEVSHINMQFIDLLTHAIISQVPTEALWIWEDTTLLSLAATRTVFLLSTVSLQVNHNYAGESVRDRVNRALGAKGKRVCARADDHWQKAFDSLVLFRHVKDVKSLCLRVVG